MLCGSHDLFEPAAFVLPIDARTAGQGPRFCVVSSAVLVHQTTRLVTREASVGFGSLTAALAPSAADYVRVPRSPKSEPAGDGIMYYRYATVWGAE